MATHPPDGGGRGDAPRDRRTLLFEAPAGSAAWAWAAPPAADTAPPRAETRRASLDGKASRSHVWADAAGA